MARPKVTTSTFAREISLSNSAVEIDRKIAVLMEMPEVVSAEDGYYPRSSADRSFAPAAAIPVALDKHQQRTFWIEALLQCPHWPGISWMY